MSCLLFNLAIEPLACTLRNSPLWGMELSGIQERLIALLFADDTTVYLSKDNDFACLESILVRWCSASRAKFNGEKTEVVPVGRWAYRDEVVRTRVIGPLNTPLPAGIHIVDQGAAMRILSMWVGNSIDSRTSWAPVLAVIKRNLEQWNRCNPTLYAQKHIISMEVGGRTQFLAHA